MFTEGVHSFKSPSELGSQFRQSAFSFNELTRSVHKPRKRDSTDNREAYSLTVPIKAVLEEYSLQEESKTVSLPLNAYDPISDPFSPRTMVKGLKSDSEDISSFSKWFFNDGTYE